MSFGQVVSLGYMSLAVGARDRRGGSGDAEVGAGIVNPSFQVTKRKK